MFSKKLSTSQEFLVSLIKELKKHFKYVSVLGSDHKTKRYMAHKKESNVASSLDNDFGYVVKMTNGHGFYEYSFDSIDKDVKEFAEEIISSTKINEELEKHTIETPLPEDEPLVFEKEDESDVESYDENSILNIAIELKDEILKRKSDLINAIAVIEIVNSSKIFITENRLLKQNYHYCLGRIMAITGENNKVTSAHKSSDGKSIKKVKEDLFTLIDSLLDIAKKLPYAKPIVPGVYDVITAPSITGLIAHEAFGHGVEMDQFIKDRALAIHYIGKRVAAPGVFMHDGALSSDNIASFYFDDDGVLAQDTLIIKDGILVNGICDLVSASQQNYKPTGNGRREKHNHKVYTRMTNTLFETGKDKLEDMIKSIDHGYMLFETSNGMEDPKNWAIQCVCCYGIEIKDGKLTDNYVAPVVMSGFVLDLLNSISMISDESEMSGGGFCGKGYKEWVRVSDGGPALKVRVKLG